MEYIRKVKIMINSEEFNNIKEALEQLELLEKDNDYENNIEIYIDINKVTYEENFTTASNAISCIESILNRI